MCRLVVWAVALLVTVHLTSEYRLSEADIKWVQQPTVDSFPVSQYKKFDPSNYHVGFGKRIDPSNFHVGFGRRFDPANFHLGFGKRFDPINYHMGFGKRWSSSSLSSALDDKDFYKYYFGLKDNTD